MTTEAFGPRRLGASGIEVSALGVGTNRWGGRGVAEPDLAATFGASLDAGVSFFDTAEVYMAGRSERLLGRCCRDDGRPVILASKFAPYPARLGGAQFTRALDATLERMGRDSIDLYYLHFPYSVVRIETWMDRMAEAVGSGKVRAVGVSNCNVSRMRRAKDALGRHGVPLAANQVQYSLVHRKPERDGVLAACRELDVALVAYRPLGGGLLQGGSSSGDKRALRDALALIAGKRGVTPSQVALNWLLCQDAPVIAIPGATKAAHATENAGAVAWRLDREELAVLDKASAQFS
jgi:aryl-alcohol dehydrogenase-like predicted oxidoreductase